MRNLAILIILYMTLKQSECNKIESDTSVTLRNEGRNLILDIANNIVGIVASSISIFGHGRNAFGNFT